MLTLYLLRHAKSSWDNAALDDFDRPLNARGQRAAPAIGRYMAEHGLKPALTLCSTAVRARETWALVAKELRCNPETRFEDALYLPATLILLVHLREAGAASPVLMVGHNPGHEEFARRLVARGEGPIDSFPTAGLAEIAFDIDDWENVDFGIGRLVRFIKPRDLE